VTKPGKPEDVEDRPELQHGTYYVYWYWNCRCDPCKAANAAKSAALAVKKQQERQGHPCLSC
jgi:hypothetical protein